MTASTAPSEAPVRTHGLRVARADDGDDAVVRVDGELELATAARVRDELSRALDTSCKRVVVDLRTLDFLDSTGIHALVEAHARCRTSRRSFVLLAGPGPVRRTLDVCGLLDELEIAPEAIAA